MLSKYQCAVFTNCHECTWAKCIWVSYPGGSICLNEGGERGRPLDSLNHPRLCRTPPPDTSTPATCIKDLLGMRDEIVVSRVIMAIIIVIILSSAATFLIKKYRRRTGQRLGGKPKARVSPPPPPRAMSRSPPRDRQLRVVPFDRFLLENPPPPPPHSSTPVSRHSRSVTPAVPPRPDPNSPAVLQLSTYTPIHGRSRSRSASLPPPLTPHGNSLLQETTFDSWTSEDDAAILRLGRTPTPQPDHHHPATQQQQQNNNQQQQDQQSSQLGRIVEEETTDQQRNSGTGYNLRKEIKKPQRYGSPKSK